MSGVWVFKKGVVRLVENPGAANSSCDWDRQSSANVRRKVLVYTPSNDVITSYAVLHQKLSALGWERYCGDHPQLVQYHKTSTLDLISLPVDFRNFKSMHMYDVVVKNRNLFQVKDV